MSRKKLLGFAAISWLPLFSLVGAASASNLFDAASEWKTTYATLPPSRPPLPPVGCRR